MTKTPTYKQWRISFNGKVFPITNEYPGERWKRIADVCEVRGGEALLEERLVTDLDILQTLADRTGWMTLRERAISIFFVPVQMMYTNKKV